MADSAIATVNPATGRTERTFEEESPAAVEGKLQAAADGWSEYRRTTIDERARWLITTAELIEGEIPDLARTVTTEMGRTFGSTKGEAAKCAMTLRWFAENAAHLLEDEVISSRAGDSRVRYQPMGPILAVMPWNLPLYQVIRFAAPNLMAGNVALVKHSSNVPQCSLVLEDLFRRAGLPDGIYQNLMIGSGRVAGLIADDRVRAVTLTGSEVAGRAVAGAAGAALKKSVLELGGSDPFVVLASADVDRAVAVGVEARVQHNGQSCIAAKRFIVHRDVYSRFESRFVEAMAALQVGDPMEPETEVGPLATATQRSEVATQVEDARRAGAKVKCGGGVPEIPGFYYPPTVLTEIRPGMAVDSQEVFGPVAMLYRVDDAVAALDLANSTSFGLGASVWTDDPEERDRFAGGLETGMVFFNSMVSSMPEMPFGGTKRSGYGRELSGLGIREFCEAKSIFVA